MKPNGKLTAVVVLACAVVGCSKRGDSQKTNTAKPVQPAAIETNAKAVDDEGFVGTPAPRITGPVSFADGDAAYQSKNYGGATKLFQQDTARPADNSTGAVTWSFARSSRNDRNA